MLRAWLYVCPFQSDGPTLRVLLFKSQEEMINSPEFLGGKNDLAVFGQLECVLPFSSTIRVIPSSHHASWNKGAESELKTGNESDS